MQNAILLPYQRRWVADDSRLKIGMMSRQVGKTFSTTFEIADDVVRAELEGRKTRWVILSRGERQAKEAMEEGIKLHLRAMGAAFESMESDYRLADNITIKQLEIATKGGSRVTALPSSPDTARGFSANVFLDEFAAHPDPYKIWAAIYPVISKPGLKLRITSTPNGRGNKFADIMSADDQIWSRHIVDIYTAIADGLDRNADVLRQGCGDDLVWRQEYELDLDVAAYNQFITYESIAKSILAQPHHDSTAPLLMGVDVARFGVDSSVIAFRQGQDAKSLPIREYKGLDTMALAGQVTQLVGVHGVDYIFVDGVGVGGGVVDRLRDLGIYNVIDVNAAAKSDMPECYNKRTEMYYNLREWILGGGTLPNDTALHKELTAAQYRYGDDRRIRLEAKDEIKKRIGKSPDKADALALTFAYPVGGKHNAFYTQHSNNIYNPLRTHIRGYDPFKGIAQNRP